MPPQSRRGRAGVTQGRRDALAMREQHAAQIGENLFGREFAQAVQMAERTLAGKARTALKMKPLYLCDVGQGRRVARIGGAVHRDERTFERCRHVHQPGVVGDDGARPGDQRARFAERCLAAQIAHVRRALRDGLRGRRIFLRPERDDARIRKRLRDELRERRKVLGRPALGRAVPAPGQNTTSGARVSRLKRADTRAASFGSASRRGTGKSGASLAAAS